MKLIDWQIYWAAWYSFPWFHKSYDKEFNLTYYWMGIGPLQTRWIKVR